MTNESLKLKLRDLPNAPGVYLLKDKSGKIIYIGKAKILRNRVRTYFSAAKEAHPKIDILKRKITDLEVLVTDNEVEALILEANLVKKHRPHYNVNLKDDKRFPYLKVTNDDNFPRLIITRQMSRDGAIYFGPYANAGAMRRTHRMLTRIFRLRTCNYKIPHPKGQNYKLCLQYHIKRCPGMCENLISSDEYAKDIDKVIRFLQGKTTDLLRQLNEEMKELSDKQQYENAAIVRDQIAAIESVQQKQKVTVDHFVDRDIIAMARSGPDLSVVVLQIREGLLIGRQNLYLRAEPSEPEGEIVSSFIRQYYLNSTFIPQEIFCSVKAADADLIRDWLREKRKGKFRLHFPKQGEKLKLVKMAETNARLLLSELLMQRQKLAAKVAKSVKLLQKDLYLPKPPVNLCAFDISNLGKTDPVGSLVWFKNGKPMKKNYRHFKIKTVVGQDDFAMMNEVVSRYFTRVVAGEAPMPDLCLIDGGKGQLSAALTALAELGINDLQILGLAKRLEEIVLPDKKKMLSLSRSSPSLRLLQRLRDEAHRFAITFHRQLRQKKISKSELDEIAGVGKKRKEKLLSHFGSLKNIAAAPVEELETVVKNKKVALGVHLYFRNK